MASPDKVDFAILRALSEDARASNVSIANMIDSSEGTVRLRIKHMVESGIIQSFTVKVRGANVRAIIEVSVNEEMSTSNAASEILGITGVSEILEVTGETDLLIYANANDTHDLNRIIDSIRIVTGTKSTKTRVILNEY